MNHIEQASRLAHAAVQMDTQGSRQEAIDLYIRSAEVLAEGIQTHKYGESDSVAMRKSMESYIVRAEALKQMMQSASGSGPILPVPPGAGAAGAASTLMVSSPSSSRRSGEMQVYAGGQDPSLLQVGFQAVKVRRYARCVCVCVIV